MAPPLPRFSVDYSDAAGNNHATSRGGYFMSIVQSAANYEAWLRSQLKDEFVEKDLKRKHQKMADGPFPFLRATYWRWAETILAICPELAGAVQVLAVGDIHVENFGTWRDADGRLVWGVNDFDEAAEMPYAIDMVRLATSAALADEERSRQLDAICERSSMDTNGSEPSPRGRARSRS